MSSDFEIRVHLEEYKSLRSEIDQYSQRIDKISGLYLTALFGLAGYLLQPNSPIAIDEYVTSVKSSESKTAFLILLIILNSTLLIRVKSFYAGLLAIAQYLHYVVRPRMNAIAAVDVLRWDEAPNLSAKKIWLPLRSIGQALFITLAETISITIAIFTSHVLFMNFHLIGLYVIAWLFIFTSLGALVAVWRAGQSFHSSSNLASTSSPPVASRRPDE